MGTPKRTFTTLIAAASLLGAACSGASTADGSATDTSDGGAANDAVAETPVSEPADATFPAVVATLSTGEQIDLGSYVGQDLLLWFWAPW